MSQPMIAATNELADALAAENAALAALDLPAAGRLLDRKQAATTAFSAAQRQAIPARGATDQTALRAAATRLQAVTEDNRQLLERAIRVQKQVLGILAQAARGADPAPRYARSGVYAARPTNCYALSASA